MIAWTGTCNIRTIISQYRIRQWSSVREMAKLLAEKYPTQDPRTLRESRLKSLIDTISKSPANVNLSSVHNAWRDIYNEKLHETAYEEAADPGEQCDGELNSWRNDRLKVEKDKDIHIPSVSAHEASTRLKQGLNKKPATDS